jgi:hypothetical protein
LEDQFGPDIRQFVVRRIKRRSSRHLQADLFGEKQSFASGAINVPFEKCLSLFRKEAVRFDQRRVNWNAKSTSITMPTISAMLIK